MKLFCIYDSLGEKVVGFFQASGVLDAGRFIRQSFSGATPAQVEGLQLRFIAEVETFLEGSEVVCSVGSELPHLSDGGPV